MLGSIDIGGATIGAFVVIAVIVLALAGYLIAVATILRRVSFTLGTVIIGVRAIANQTAPVGEVVGDIATNVASIQNALRGVLGLPGIGPRVRVGPAAEAASLSPRSGGTGVVTAGRSRSRAPGGTGRVSMRNR